MRTTQFSRLIGTLFLLSCGHFTACSGNSDSETPEDTSIEDEFVDRRDTNYQTDDGDVDDADLDVNDPDSEDSNLDTDNLQDSDVEIDTIDTTPDDPEPEVVENCDGRSGFTGLSASDINGDPLEIGDQVSLTIEVMNLNPSDGDSFLFLQTSNLTPNLDSITRDGNHFGDAEFVGPFLTIPLSGISSATFVVETTTGPTLELVTAFAFLRETQTTCEVPRSRSGAILQLIGGYSKTPLCVDMRQVRSVQVAPMIPQRNTENYAEENGIRDDLWVDDFIFCPQAPTKVHEAEFCIRRGPNQDITLAGSYHADDSWEVDDFILFEVYQSGALIHDGFTTQRHPGRQNTFYCNPIDQLMCETDCTASLTVINEDRQITAIAVAQAGEGDFVRRHHDGDVSIASLLPEGDADIRITALDQGAEGTLQPGLFLISADPE